MQKMYGAMIPLLAATLVSACSGTFMTTQPAQPQGQKEFAEKENSAVVSTGNYSVVSAKLLDRPPSASGIPLLLGITNLSPKPFTVDHSIVTGKGFPAKMMLVPLGVEEAKKHLGDGAGPGKAVSPLAGLGVVVGVPGGDTGSAGATAQAPSPTQDGGNRAAAGDLPDAVETNYLSKTTVQPNSTTDGLVMLKLTRPDGAPIRGASELVDQVINAHVIVGADIHVFRLSFVKLEK